jgi:hypothetical protein
MSIHYLANEIQGPNQRRIKKTRRVAGAVQVKIMRIANQTTAELIHQAEDMGFLSVPLTVKCSFCSSLFPREYTQCPKCTAEHLLDIRIDFEF